MNLALELVGRSGLSRASVAGSLPPSCTVEFEVSGKRRLMNSVICQENEV